MYLLSPSQKWGCGQPQRHEVFLKGTPCQTEVRPNFCFYQTILDYHVSEKVGIFCWKAMNQAPRFKASSLMSNSRNVEWPVMKSFPIVQLNIVCFRIYFKCTAIEMMKFSFHMLWHKRMDCCWKRERDVNASMSWLHHIFWWLCSYPRVQKHRHYESQNVCEKVDIANRTCFQNVEQHFLINKKMLFVG